MINCLDRNFVKADQVCDFLPIVSTFSNLWDIFFKAVLHNENCAQRLEKSFYAKHIKDKSLGRCILLLLPPCTLAFAIFKLFIFIIEQSEPVKKAKQDRQRAEQEYRNVQQQAVQELERLEIQMNEVKEQQEAMPNLEECFNDIIEKQNVKIVDKHIVWIREELIKEYAEAVKIFEEINPKIQQGYEDWQLIQNNPQKSLDEKKESNSSFLILMNKEMRLLEATLRIIKRVKEPLIPFKENEEAKEIIQAILQEPDIALAKQNFDQNKQDFLIKIREIKVHFEGSPAFTIINRKLELVEEI